ncbi:hypothetical protein KBI52_04525 [Microvirga sp. HBU67558]|uniref:hypothetical protein n=1 Tax=Microvirga TaxID=186650 RepID=UPI001B366805|nr:MULTISPECIES: hypothetical protein [unclassified Microvirga]MBQ0819488.1 hypothetical protein [Microvirga sp. HBU67558]
MARLHRENPHSTIFQQSIMSQTESLLYFITTTNGDGDNLDLFVRASNPTSAVISLLAHYGIAPGDLHDVKAFCVPTDCASSGPLAWHTVVQEQPLKTISGPASSHTVALTVLVPEHDTIMAALRVYQRYLECEQGKDPEFDQDIAMIAGDHGQILKSQEIDLLCERINI